MRKGIVADCVLAPILDVLWRQCFLDFNGRDVESPAGVCQGFQQIGVFRFCIPIRRIRTITLLGGISLSYCRPPFRRCLAGVESHL